MRVKQREDGRREEEDEDEERSPRGPGRKEAARRRRSVCKCREDQTARDDRVNHGSALIR